MSGIIVGRFFRNCRWIRIAGSKTMPTVLLLLFLFGADIGSDDVIMRSLPDLGAWAAVMAVACVTGSVLFSVAIYRFVRNRIGQRR